MVPSIQICGTFHRGDSAGGGGGGARTSCRFQPLLTHKSVSGKQNHKRCKEALKTQPMLLEPAAHAHRYPETNGEHVLWSGEGVVGKGEGGSHAS